MMDARFLIIETSGRIGQVALATAADIVAQRHLDETRRHARDLAPAVHTMLREQNWRPADIDAVVVSRGPGSYTGLRVGIMSAKAFAFAVGCKLFGVETFAAIARQAPAGIVDVIADAQQRRVYWQRFRNGTAITDLAISSLEEWRATVPADAALSGPAIEFYREQLPTNPLIDAVQREPHCATLLTLARERWATGQVDDVYSLEPLYLRPSAAEQQWDRNR